MKKDKITKKKTKIWILIVILVVVILGGVLFVGAVAGWFSDSKFSLSAEYYCDGECAPELMELTAEDYEGLLEAGKSFILFIDQDGCQTADKLRGFVLDYMDSENLRAYRMSFSDMRETSLYPTIKYYPSVAFISDGKVVGFLRADSNEDAEAYNSEDAFYTWMNRYLKAQ